MKRYSQTLELVGDSQMIESYIEAHRHVWPESQEGIRSVGILDIVGTLSMYRGVMRPYPHTRSTEALEGFAAYRGCQAGCNYAEAFEVILRRQ